MYLVYAWKKPFLNLLYSLAAPEAGSLLSSGNAPLESGTGATPLSTGSADSAEATGDARSIYQKAVDAATGAKEAFFGHPVETSQAVLSQNEGAGTVPPASPRTLTQKVTDAATGAKEGFFHGIVSVKMPRCHPEILLFRSEVEKQSLDYTWKYHCFDVEGGVVPERSEVQFLHSRMASTVSGASLYLTC
jgi:hypothetical protein